LVFPFRFTATPVSAITPSPPHPPHFLPVRLAIKVKALRLHGFSECPLFFFASRSFARPFGTVQQSRRTPASIFFPTFSANILFAVLRR